MLVYFRALLTILLTASLLSSCIIMPQPIGQESSVKKENAPLSTNVIQSSVRTYDIDVTPQTLTFPNLVPPQPIEQVNNPPADPANQTLSLTFTTSAPGAGQIKMPNQGKFQVVTSSGPSFQILDNDATDGVAKIQLPSQIFDIYLRPETSSNSPTTCPTPSPSSLTGTQNLDLIDQSVIAKANQLIANGQSQCTYLPTSSQRQNANCNSTPTGFQCSGSINKTINSASCPEIAIYSGAMNINHALSNSNLFVAVQNNLTINQSVTGILCSRGDLNTSLNNSSQLNGVFVGARSNNLNLGGNAKIQGLYSILNSGSLSMNLNPSAIFEGELCTTGTSNINRNGNSQLIYNPNKVTPWQNEFTITSSLMCSAGNKPYTQTIALDCPTPAPVQVGRIKIEDELYYIAQTLNASSDGHWYKLSGRPMPVPSEWYSKDNNQYIFTLTNEGVPQLSAKWVTTSSKTFPAGIAEIGTNGGTVELPGIGKLVIPAGSTDSSITVKMSQIFSAPEILRFDPLTEQMKAGSDYISPIIKIEPFGLRLKQAARLYLSTDLDRLGNNSPGLVRWFTSNKIEEDTWSYRDTESEGLKLSQFTSNMPLLIDEFQYFTKTIDANLKPDSNAGFMELEDVPGFRDEIDGLWRTQAAPNVCTQTAPLAPICLPLQTCNIEPYKSLAVDLMKQSTKAFEDYRIATNTCPNGWTQGKFPIYLELNNSRSYTRIEKDSGHVEIHFEFPISYSDTVPHEMWHLFQLQNIDELTFKFLDQSYFAKWAMEGPATYVGGYNQIMNPNIYKSQVSPSKGNSYSVALRGSATHMQLPMNIKKVTESDNYLSTGFFTYLSSPYRGLTLKSGVPLKNALSVVSELSAEMDKRIHGNNFSWSTLATEVLSETLYTLSPDKGKISNKNALTVYYDSFSIDVLNGIGYFLTNNEPKIFPQTVPPQNSDMTPNNFYPTKTIDENTKKRNAVITGTFKEVENKVHLQYGKLGCLSADYFKITSKLPGKDISQGEGHSLLYTKMAKELPEITDASGSRMINYNNNFAVVYKLKDGSSKVEFLVRGQESSDSKSVISVAPPTTIEIYVITSIGEYKSCDPLAARVNPELFHQYYSEVMTYYGPSAYSSRSATPEEEIRYAVTKGTRIVLKTKGVEQNSYAIFQANGAGSVKVKVDAIWPESPTSDEQNVMVEYPQQAVTHGWVKVVSDGDESNQLDDVAYPCWAPVVGTSNFNVADGGKSLCHQN